MWGELTGSVILTMKAFLVKSNFKKSLKPLQQNNGIKQMKKKTELNACMQKWIQKNLRKQTG